MKKAAFIFAAIAISVIGILGIVANASALPYPTGVGGTGTSITPASGTVLIGNGAGSYTPSFLTPGANIQITNGSGTVTIAVTGTATGTVYLLQGGHGISLSPSSITASGTIAVNTSTVIADVVASGQFLPSSTTYVASVNGQSGAVTIGVPATTTINGAQATVFKLIGDGTTVTSTVNGTTTTFSIINTGNWAGTWQGVNSSTFYPASNPNGYISGNQTITIVAAGDATGTNSGTTLITHTITVTGLQGKSLPALATGTLKYTGGSWTFDNNTYLLSGINVTTTAPLGGGGALTSAGLTLTCATCLTANQTITLTGAVTGSGATSIATTYTTSTLYALFSGSGPVTFNTSTGAIGWTNSLNYITAITVNGQSGTSFNIVAGQGVTSTVSGATTTITLNLGPGCSGGNFVQTISPTGTISCAIPSGAATTTINGALGALFNFVASSTGSVLSITTSTAGGSSTINFLLQLSNYLTAALQSLNGATSSAQTIVGGTGISVATAASSTNSTTTITNTGVTSFTGAGCVTAANSTGSVSLAVTCISGNQSITFTINGDATGTASGATAITDSITVTGLNGKALPTNATGTLQFTSNAWHINLATTSLGIYDANGNLSSYLGSACSGGQYVTGISATGTVACGTPPTAVGTTTPYSAGYVPVASTSPQSLTNSQIYVNSATQDTTVGSTTDWGPFSVYTTSSYPTYNEDSYGDALQNGIGNLTNSQEGFYPPQESVIDTMQAGNAWTLNSADGTLVNSTSTFIKGIQSVGLTSGTSTGSYVSIVNSGLGTTNFTGKNLLLWIYVTSSTNLNDFDFYTCSGSCSNSYQFKLRKWLSSTPAESYFQSGVWTPIILPFAADGSNIIKNGSPDITAITKYELALDNAVSNVTSTVYLNEIASVPQQSQPIVTISFDNGWASTWTQVMPQLSLYGFKGDFFIIPYDQITDHTGSFATVQQLQALQAQGMEMDCHTYDHTSLATTTAAFDDQEFLRCKNWLLQNGLYNGLNGLAWPNGDYSTTSVTEAQKYFSFSRGIDNNSAVIPPDVAPPAFAYNIPALDVVSSTATSTFASMLTACKTGNEWCNFYFHDITTGTPSNADQMASSTFASMMQILSASGMSVQTYGQVINSLQARNPLGGSASMDIYQATTTAGLQYAKWRTSIPLTITSVSCDELASATTTFDLYKSTALASVANNGDIVGSLVCGVGGYTTTTFTNSTLNAGDFIIASTTATAGTPQMTTINISYTK